MLQHVGPLAGAALTVFGAVFAFSTFVIGPAVAGGGSAAGQKAAPSDSSHESHHR